MPAFEYRQAEEIKEALEQPHELGFGERIEMELEADYRGGRVGRHRQLIDADGEQSE